MGQVKTLSLAPTQKHNFIYLNGIRINGIANDFRHHRIPDRKIGDLLFLAVAKKFDIIDGHRLDSAGVILNFCTVLFTVSILVTAPFRIFTCDAAAG